jgi:hypothetical protein
MEEPTPFIRMLIEKEAVNLRIKKSSVSCGEFIAVFIEANI